MYREFKNLLESAKGISEFVIAVNVDLRGFTPASMRLDSAQVAVFIKHAYRVLIEDYFNMATFYKPAGDGLLFVVPFDESTLVDCAQKVVQASFSALDEFGTRFGDIPVINFDVPTRLGIGISRGPACRLESDERVLDYCGSVLNMASRLMDLARPSGLVIDVGFGIDLLRQEKIDRFDHDSVYIRGIAEETPVTIHFTRDLTSISQVSRRPIQRIRWNTVQRSLTLREIHEYGPRFIMDLPEEPLSEEDIAVRISHDAIINNRRRKEVVHTFPFFDFVYRLEVGAPRITLHFDSLVAQLEKSGVKASHEVQLEVSYPVI